MLKKVIVTIILIFAGFLSSPAPGLAATYNWVGGDGNWREASNWEPAGIPNKDDTAIINNGHTVEITDFGYVHQLQVGSTSALNIAGSTMGCLFFQSGLPDNHIINYGTIRVGAGSGYLGCIFCYGTPLTLQGTGSLILDSPDFAITGNGVINTADHTMRGGGAILNLLVNQGQVIADNGTLLISGMAPVDNTSGVMSASGSGNVLKISGVEGGLTGGAINPQDGKVNFTNADMGNVTFGPGVVEIGTESDPGTTCVIMDTVIFDPGTIVTIRQDSQLVGPGDPNNLSAVVNNGAIFMSSNDVGHPTYVKVNLILQGMGTLTMGGAGNQVSNVINTASHTIQGGGSIMWTTNDGAIIANSGTLNIGGLTGTGTITVADEATLAVTDYWIQIGDLTLSRQANLTVNINSGWGWIDLQRNFAFSQTDPAKWSWASGNGLRMSGKGPWQTIEVGSQDFGASASGLTNNFALPQLWVTETDTRVKLVDLIDNGHRVDGPEALYVTALMVFSETTLDLNGLKLYTYLDGKMHRVRAGEGALFGGGRIVDKQATTGALFLLLRDD